VLLTETEPKTVEAEDKSVKPHTLVVTCIVRCAPHWRGEVRRRVANARCAPRMTHKAHTFGKPRVSAHFKHAYPLSNQGKRARDQFEMRIGRNLVKP